MVKNLKGVSKRFSPQEAIVIYEGIIKSEKRYYDSIKESPPKLDRTIEIDTPEEKIQVIQRASFYEFKSDRNGGHIDTGASPEESPEFSPHHPTQRIPPDQSRRIPHTPTERRLIRNYHHQQGDRIQRSRSLVALSRSKGGFSHSGYIWPKYKFFSNGACAPPCYYPISHLFAPSNHSTRFICLHGNEPLSFTDLRRRAQQLSPTSRQYAKV